MLPILGSLILFSSPSKRNLANLVPISLQSIKDLVSCKPVEVLAGPRMIREQDTQHTAVLFSKYTPVDFTVLRPL